MAVSVWRGDLRGRVLVGAILVVLVLLALFIGVMVVIRSPLLGTRLIRCIGRIRASLAEPAEHWVSSLDHLRERPPGTAALVRVVAWSAK